MSRNARHSQNAESGKTSPKGLRKFNEMSKNAPEKKLGNIGKISITEKVLSLVSSTLWEMSKRMTQRFKTLDSN